MELVKVDGEAVVFKDDSGRVKTDSFSNLLDSDKNYRFSDRDLDKILSNIKCNDGFYEKDRLGNIVLISYWRLPTLFFLISIFTACMVMSCMCTMRQVFVLDYKIFSGFLFFSLAFSCSDIINELFGYRTAKNVVIFIATVLIVVGLIHYLTLSLDGLYFGESDSEYLKIFNYYPMAFITHGTALMVAYIANCKIFSWIKFELKNKHLWARVFLSTFIGQFIYSTVITPMAYMAGRHPDKSILDLVNIVFSSHFLKMGIALVTIPVIYFTVLFVRKLEKNYIVNKRIDEINYIKTS